MDTDLQNIQSEMTQGSDLGRGLLWCGIYLPGFGLHLLFLCLGRRLLWRLISNADVVCVYVGQNDYYYEYTECDSTGSRWRVAIPQTPGACIGLPEPVRGTECSKLTISVCACVRVCMYACACQ